MLNRRTNYIMSSSKEFYVPKFNIIELNLSTE